jgi:large conductance mechanosensitive channel
MRGNVDDMAVGIEIGASIGRIVTSFTDDLLMPPIGMFTGGADFSDLSLTLKQAVGETAAITVNYGAFINVVLDFAIIAFAVFLLVKAMNAAKKQEEEAPAAPPAPTREEVLLMEIRDALRR